MAGAASARVTVNVGGLQPPPQAAAVGYTRLAFNEDFNDTSGIDMADSRAPGFKWYRFKPFGYGVLGTGEFSVSGSVLTLNQTVGSDANYGLGSTCGVGKGFGITNGAYVEGRIANAPTGGGGWPAFWSMSNKHLWGTEHTNFWEVDFYEKLGNVDQHVFAVHNWLTNTNHNLNINQHNTMPAGYDFNAFHTYGWLWLPGNRYQVYRDNVLINTFTYSSFPWLANGDDESMPIILGTGSSWPMRVDWVRVWQAPT
jgi:beta-glucanase (GH16 family)